ncbi:hypothetical protein Tco_0795286 [Tanacetum coccineum]
MCNEILRSTTRDSCIIALQNKQTELEKYMTFNDHTVDYDKLECKLNETLGLLAQKEIDIKEGLKLKAYEISVVKEKHDELVKQSLLTKSHYEGLVKEKTKINIRAGAEQNSWELNQITKQNHDLTRLMLINSWELTAGRFSKNLLTGFPAQSVGSSNTDVLDSPCLLVLITGTSQSRQHGFHFNVNTLSNHLKDVLARLSRIMRGIFVQLCELYGVSTSRILTLCPNEIYTLISSGSRLDLCTFGFSNRRLEQTATYSILTISE